MAIMGGVSLLIRREFGETATLHLARVDQAMSTVISSWSESGLPCSSTAAHVLGREAVRPRVKNQSMRRAFGGGRPSGMRRRV